MSTIRSAPLRGRQLNAAKLGGALVGIAISAFVWIVGARFTLDGIIVALNWLLAFVRVPLQIGALSWEVYLALVPIPLLFSIVEWKNAPRQQLGAETSWASAAMICVWLIVSGMDLATTFLGLGAPSLPTSELLRWFSESLIAKGLATAFLTFWPEWVLKSMIGTIRAELNW